MNSTTQNAETTTTTETRLAIQFPDNLTLRDYFAAKAIQGYISNTEWMNQLAKTVGEYTEKVDQCNAVRAYKAADVMLEERSK